MTALRDYFDLWYACICDGFVDGDHFRVLASWSGAQTVLESGTEASLDLTLGLRELADRLRGGEICQSRTSEGVLGLLDAIRRDEGFVEALLVPLSDASGVRALLAVGSSSEDEYGEVERVFFRRLGQGLEHALLRQVDAWRPTTA